MTDTERPNPDRAEAPPPGAGKPARPSHWPVLLTLTAVIVIFALCVALWRVAVLRPFLVAGGTGIAAFLGPLPGLLLPETRGKWIASILIAALITAGTGLATMDLSDNLLAAETQRGELAQRLSTLSDSVKDLVKDQRPEVRDALFLSTGNFYKPWFQAHRFQAILDMAAIMLAVNHEDGHSLYYAGETYRVLGNDTEMVGNFQNFIAWADHHPESRDGDAAACYRRSSGYCLERLGWIEHEMANYYLGLAGRRTGEAKLDPLATALNYETQNVDVRPSGFKTDSHMRSSCDLLKDIARELKALNKSADDADATRAKIKPGCKDS